MTVPHISARAIASNPHTLQIGCFPVDSIHSALANVPSREKVGFLVQTCQDFLKNYEEEAHLLISINEQPHPAC